MLTRLETPEIESEIHRATEEKPCKKSEKGIKREVDKPTFKSLDKEPHAYTTPPLVTHNVCSSPADTIAALSSNGWVSTPAGKTAV